MDDLIEEIARRRAKRGLSDRAIDDAAIERLIEAATLAPSCANNQSWRFVVVQDPAKLGIVKSHLTRANAWATPSPCIILVATKLSYGCRLDDSRDYALFDTGMACMNLQLQATREGLIAHPIAGFKPKEIKGALGIPDDVILVTLIVLGHPSVDLSLLDDKQKERESGPRIRKAKNEVESRAGWTFE